MNKCKKNCQHSKLATTLKNLVIYYNCQKDAYENYRSESTYEYKLICKNTLNFVAKMIVETKKKIKDCQRDYQTTVVNPRLKAQKPTPVNKSNVLPKELFISFMDIIKKYMERDEATCKDLNNIIEKRYPEMANCGFEYFTSPNSELYNELVEWAAKAIGDATVGDEWGNWIAYYVYETDWGRAFGDHKVTDHGENVPFNTVSEVYDAVQRFNKKK